MKKKKIKIYNHILISIIIINVIFLLKHSHIFHNYKYKNESF